MKIFDLDRGAPVSSPAAPLSIALGSFDGVHIGHRELIRRAAASDAASAVWTFDRNPFGVPFITSLEEKLTLFRDCGAKYALVCGFDEVSEKTPEEFVSGLCALGAVRCVCGFNYTFGKNKAGDAAMLAGLCAEKGIFCEAVAPVEYGGEPVSSTRVRRALADGDMALAAALLGRNYAFTYPVTHGNEIGRMLGYPTANQNIPAERAPLKRGVYVTRALGLPSVTNIGVRPTVCDGGAVVCETHIIGADGDLYGKDLTVEFLSFLRDEQKFDSLDALKRQLGEDAARAVGYDQTIR